MDSFEAFPIKRWSWRGTTVCKAESWTNNAYRLRFQFLSVKLSIYSSYSFIFIQLNPSLYPIKSLSSVIQAETDVIKADSDGSTPLIILIHEICKGNHETNTMEDGYSSAHTARLIDTSQRIMSGNLQRGPLRINTNASSIGNNSGVQHDRHLMFVKNTPSTTICKMNNISGLYMFVPLVNTITWI